MSKTDFYLYNNAVYHLCRNKIWEGRYFRDGSCDYCNAMAPNLLLDGLGYFERYDKLYYPTLINHNIHPYPWLVTNASDNFKRFIKERTLIYTHEAIDL